MLTAEQKEKLHKAIDLACVPGVCRYVVNEAPGCIIGQLAFMEGFSLETMKGWDEHTKNGGGGSVMRLTRDSVDGAERLAGGYPVTLLQGLQNGWDRTSVSGLSEADVRKLLHRLVEDYTNAE